MFVLVRYAEIGTKGKNRVVFERKLEDNIRCSFARNDVQIISVSRPRGRIVIETKEGVGFLKMVFGIASFSEAFLAGRSIDEAKHTIEKTGILLELQKLKKQKPGMTFRVSCQRLDKNFPLTSKEIEQELGAFILQQIPKLKVDLEKFDFELGVEIIDGKIYVFTSRTKCQGGLPTGIGGKAAAVISDKNDLLAALIAMRRGASVIPVLKRRIGLSLLEAYGNREKAIDLSTGFNKKKLEKLLAERQARAVITGETFSTLRSKRRLSAFAFDLPILRPLIFLSEKETRKIFLGFSKGTKGVKHSVKKIN